MLNYILFLSVLLYTLNQSNKIEGIDGPCCDNNKVTSEFTKGFHNSSCVYVKDEDGNNIPLGPPDPVKRCYKDSDRSKKFNCDGEECSSSNGCASCNNMCEDITDGQCIPTIRKDGSEYIEGGYCINSTCEEKEISECTGECKIVNDDECVSNKYYYKEGEEGKQRLTKDAGISLDYENGERYKEYARNLCDPFKGTSFQQTDLDSKWSEEDYEESESDDDLFNKVILFLLIICVFVIPSVILICVYFLDMDISEIKKKLITFFKLN
jgi:hypothetical protein